jgi:hypothetical protein
MMNRFKSFLDSIASPGGNILILCFFVVASGFAMNRLHYSDQIDTAMLSAFSGFCGALLAQLTQGIRTSSKPEDSDKKP